MTSDYTAEPPERRDRESGSRGAPHRGGVRSLTAILPNGRVAWLNVAPPLAEAPDVNQLAQVAAHAAEHRHAAARSSRRAIKELSQRVLDDAERFYGARGARTRRFRRRLVATYNRLDRRITKEAARFRFRLARQMAIQVASAARLRRRDLWDKVVIVSSLPLFAAYGEKGHPLGVNNVTLLLTLLIWLVGDEITHALFGPREQSPYAVRDTDAWSYVAPIGNALTGWWLLDGRQHERFVSGVATQFTPITGLGFAPPGELVLIAVVDLSTVVARDHLADFQTFTGVPAAATVRSIRWAEDGKTLNPRVASLSAVVAGPALILRANIAGDGSLDGLKVVDALEVAWVVDTTKPAAMGAIH